MTTYTNLTKPTGTSYTNSNPAGKIDYDQFDIAYDDASMYYDGINPNMYTDVTKPNGTSYTNLTKPS